MSLELRASLARFGKIAAVLAIFFTLFMGQVAHAATDPNNPNGSALLIKGTVKNEKEPVAGVEFHITGNGVDEKVTSGEDGKWHTTLHDIDE